MGGEGLACERQVLAGRQEPGGEQQVAAGLVGVRRDSRQEEEARSTRAPGPSWHGKQQGCGEG